MQVNGPCFGESAQVSGLVSHDVKGSPWLWLRIEEIGGQGRATLGHCQQQYWFAGGQLHIASSGACSLCPACLILDMAQVSGHAL